MAIKTKFTLSNTLSSDGMSQFNEMIDESFDTNIGDTISENDDMSYSDAPSNSYGDSDVNLSNNKNNDDICPFKDENLNNYDDVNEKMTEIYNDFIKDTKLTMANLSTMAMNEAYIKARWCSKAVAAKVYTKKLKGEYEELKGKITEMVSSKAKTGAFLTKKASIDSYVYGDANLKALKKKIEDASLVEELYKEFYSSILKNLGFQIRNSIDTLNFERGT